MKLQRPRREPPRIQLSPLIDVVFILLIFVVLVARFVDQERLDVDLPTADAGRPAEVQSLQLTVDIDGTVTIDGEVVAREDLADVLRGHRSRYARAVLVADREARLQHAVDVLSTCKLAGYDAVALATQPPGL